jgi:hypothetical protein
MQPPPRPPPPASKVPRAVKVQQAEAKRSTRRGRNQKTEDEISMRVKAMFQTLLHRCASIALHIWPPTPELIALFARVDLPRQPAQTQRVSRPPAATNAGNRGRKLWTAADHIPDPENVSGGDGVVNSDDDMLEGGLFDPYDSDFAPVDDLYNTDGLRAFRDPTKLDGAGRPRWFLKDRHGRITESIDLRDAKTEAQDQRTIEQQNAHDQPDSGDRDFVEASPPVIPPPGKKRVRRRAGSGPPRPPGIKVTDSRVNRAAAPGRTPTPAAAAPARVPDDDDDDDDNNDDDDAAWNTPSPPRKKPRHVL